MKSMGSFWLRFASGGPKYDSCQLHVLQTRTPAAMKSVGSFGCALRWEDQSMTVASCMLADWTRAACMNATNLKKLIDSF